LKLIVGLGNPGNKYSLTRHNIGFIVLDFFALRYNLSFKPGNGDFYFCDVKNCLQNFSAPDLNTESNSVKSDDFVLLKPTSYMNNSGLALAQFLNLYPFDFSDILIVYDDFQIPLGTIRIRPSGSDGGHNGIADIIYRLNSVDIPRMRIGIGLNSDESPAPVANDFVSFVLSNFSKSEIEIIKKLMPTYCDAIYDFIISDDIKNVMNRFNKNFLPFSSDKSEPDK